MSAITRLALDQILTMAPSKEGFSRDAPLTQEQLDVAAEQIVFDEHGNAVPSFHLHLIPGHTHSKCLIDPIWVVV